MKFATLLNTSCQSIINMRNMNLKNTYLVVFTIRKEFHADSQNRLRIANI